MIAELGFSAIIIFVSRGLEDTDGALHSLYVER